MEASAAGNTEKAKSNDKKLEGKAGQATEKGVNKDGAVPPETARDLMPFPLNRAFISQPILSDELREEIWTRIMKDGKSVRTVSAELGVEMSRVGAVVRLKEVEREWQRIVSS